MGSWGLQVPQSLTLEYPPSWLTACGDRQSFAVYPYGLWPSGAQGVIPLLVAQPTHTIFLMTPEGESQGPFRATGAFLVPTVSLAPHTGLGTQ